MNFRFALRSRSFAIARASTGFSGRGVGGVGTRHFATGERDIPAHFRVVEKSSMRSENGELVYDSPYQHPAWTLAELEAGVVQEHKEPQNRTELLAYNAIRVVRLGFDVFSGYSFGKLTEAKLLRRIIFLETVAGIPGFVAAALRHLRSLRRIKRDYGWIHSLLAEAENERMHMLMFSEMKNPSLVFRAAVLVTQGIFWNAFFTAYLISPKFCHSFVGYLEESAVHTYTTAIDACDNDLKEWGAKKATPIARRYYQLDENATMKDVLKYVRLDECWHRDANHDFSEIATDEFPHHADHTKLGKIIKESNVKQSP
eukprot:TRINITY_DN336_c0_g1_i4.p1 TRINITY_DN336_c0_g1~~TRINITY_DN336_c0_g1_i4.p1  ORF type:complete len:314 (-),score=37.39 TRINITY_DN336_c0_g1_i4:53-994(-)